ncbi:hypothetical protein AAHA92_01986 [Salvia divinorum]|uniref:Uncharacterized protein n=1 Tax=Salvia divinorum TaxID=28513 RepID=A0ABD1ICC4_SALDI
MSIDVETIARGRILLEDLYRWVTIEKLEQLIVNSKAMQVERGFKILAYSHYYIYIFLFTSLIAHFSLIFLLSLLSQLRLEFLHWCERW